MTIYITAVHMVGGTDHQHIQSVRWVNAQSRQPSQDLTSTIVNWIKNQGGDARVADGRSYVQVGVVHPQLGAPYLRTHADGVWKDNLLALPRY